MAEQRDVLADGQCYPRCVGPAVLVRVNDAKAARLGHLCRDHSSGDLDGMPLVRRLWEEAGTPRGDFVPLEPELRGRKRGWGTALLSSPGG